MFCAALCVWVCHFFKNEIGAKKLVIKYWVKLITGRTERGTAEKKSKTN